MIKTILKTKNVATLLQRITSGFVADRRGNIAVISAISAIPVVAAIGCVVDYSTAAMIKTKLQAAADAATLAAVSANSPVVATAKAMTANGTVANGQTYTQNFFDSNLSTAPANVGYNSPTRTASVSKTGTTINATLSYTATVPTFFLGMIGHSTIAVSGNSTSSYTLPSFIDFYLMLDVSASMGMPSTAAEQTRLQTVNPDNVTEYPSGCTFACHFTAQNGCRAKRDKGIGRKRARRQTRRQEDIARALLFRAWARRRRRCRAAARQTATTNSTSNCGNKVNWNNTQVSSCATAGTTSCIQLRLDAVGYAVNALLQQATTTEAADNIPNQFRVGLYPFIQNLCYATTNNSSSCSVGLTTNLTGGTISSFATQLASLLDTGQNSTLGSGGTHFENALNTMNSSVIPNPVGTGTSAAPQPFLFIVTDGSQDYQTQWAGNWSSQNYHSSGAVPYCQFGDRRSAEQRHQH